MGSKSLVVRVAEVVHTVLIWLHELEDRFGLLEIPDDDLSIFTGAGQDMGDNSVPADCSDTVSFVQVGLTWFKLGWLFDVLTDVLDQHL